MAAAGCSDASVTRVVNVSEPAGDDH